MDLNQLQHQAQYLPDQALANEVQGQGGTIPPFIALAELQRRQSLRAGGGNTQRPHGTVASQVLSSMGHGMQTLNALGPRGQQQQNPIINPSAQPQMLMQPGALPTPMQASQPQGIAQAGAPGMKRGGIVGLAGGSPSPALAPGDGVLLPQFASDSAPPDPSMQDMLQSLLAPKFDKYDPPPVKPIDVQGAMGPGQDYGEVLGGLRSLRGQQVGMTPQQAMRYEIAAMGAGPANDPVKAISQAELATMGAAHEWGQQATDNSRLLLDSQYHVQDSQQKRHDELARDLMHYQYLAQQEQYQRYHDAYGANFQIGKEKADQADKVVASIGDPKKVAWLEQMTGQMAQNPHLAPDVREMAQNYNSMFTGAIQRQQELYKQQKEAEYAEKRDLQKDVIEGRHEDARIAAGSRQIVALVNRGDITSLPGTGAGTGSGSGAGSGNPTDAPNTPPQYWTAGEDSQGNPIPLIGGNGLPLIKRPGQSPAAARAAAGMVDPATYRTLLRKTPGLLNQIIDIDPSFDESGIDSRFAFNKERTKYGPGSIGGQSLALNKLVHHASLLSETIDALQNGTFVPSNTLMQKLKETFGWAPGNNFNLVRDFVVTEADKVAQGGAPHQTQLEASIANMKKANSPKALREALDMVMGVAGGGMQSLNDQGRQNRMGSKFTVLTDASRRTLVDHGYDPETFRRVEKQTNTGGSNAPQPNQAPSASNNPQPPAYVVGHTYPYGNGFVKVTSVENGVPHGYPVDANGNDLKGGK